jgi:cysteinyl-tRNA synthetase
VAADEAERAAEEALFDDLNAPEAMAALFTFIRKGNAELDRKGGDREAIERARAVFARIDGVLDVVPEKEAADEKMTVWVEERLAARRAARERRDYAMADAIRKEVEGAGIAIEDSAAGTRWKRVR